MPSDLYAGLALKGFAVGVDAVARPQGRNLVTRTATLEGRSGNIRLYAPSEAPPDAPLLICAEKGYACFAGAARKAPAPFGSELVELADRIRHAETGAYVGIARVPGAPRPIAFVQSNRGTYYKLHNGAGDNVHAWRNFFYRTTSFLLDRLEEDPSFNALLIEHVAGFGWPPDSLTCVLEALGHHADGNGAGRLPSLGEVHFSVDVCSLHSPKELERASRPLAGEQTAPGAPERREIAAEEIDPRRFGADAVAQHVRLWRIDVETR
jgi:hypothetical protein